MMAWFETWQAHWMSGWSVLTDRLQAGDTVVLGLVLALLVGSVLVWMTWRQRLEARAIEAALEQHEPFFESPASGADRGSIPPVNAPVAPVIPTVSVTAPVTAPAPVPSAPAVNLADLQALQAQIAALQQQVEAQASTVVLQGEAIRALESYLDLLQQQGQRAPAMAGQETPSTHLLRDELEYEQAIALAERGSGTDDLMSRTGVSAREAELILQLHGLRAR